MCNVILDCCDALHDQVKEYGWKSLIIQPDVTYQRRWLESGERYEGYWHNVKRYAQKQGRMEYLNDDIYDGDFDKGLKHGVGVMDYANGEQYDGDWEMDMYHGKGTFYAVNNDCYAGDWKHNYRHGKGVYTWESGNEYRGDWDRGQ